MLQPSIAPQHHRRLAVSIVSILLIVCVNAVDAVKPVWRTPVTNVRKNATARTQRASNSVPSEGYSGFSDQKQAPYYTRPEDFKVPDYRQAKAQNPSFQLPLQQFIPNRQFIPQNYPQQQYRQFVPPQQQQFWQNFRGPQQGNGFQQPRFQGYPNPRQYPIGPFYPPPGHVFVPLNSGRNQWNIPPNALPYWEGPGPIPPQGAYGPTTSSTTTEAMRPSVIPENYKGTIPMEPSVNPELVSATSTAATSPTRGQAFNSVEVSRPVEQQQTQRIPTQPTPSRASTASAPTTSRTLTPEEEFLKNWDKPGTSTASPETSTAGEAGQEFTKGWYNPTSTASTGPRSPPSPTVTFPDYTTTFFDMETNPFTSAETTSAESRSPYVEDITRPTLTGGPTPPQGTTAQETRTSPKFLTRPAIVEHSEFFPEVAVTRGQPELEQTKTSYFPRPVTSQVYQPPGHLPEDFSKHIDVNFVKPNRTCAGPLCNIDGDKVSLYKPETVEAGHRPTLVISNAAKGDAARLGYIPPPPRPVAEFENPPTSTEYYSQKFIPGYRIPQGEYGIPHDVQTPTPELFHPEIPSGPHVFMPPQNFPAPPAPTQVPPAWQSSEATRSPSSFSPTAKTIAPTAPSVVYTTQSPPTTRQATTYRVTTAAPNTFPTFETTTRRPEVPTTFPTAPPTLQASTRPPLYTQPEITPSSASSWSPTYKTVPTSATTPAGSTLNVIRPRVSTEFPRPSTPPTTVVVTVETLATTRPHVTGVPFETTRPPFSGAPFETTRPPSVGVPVETTRPPVTGAPFGTTQPPATLPPFAQSTPTSRAPPTPSSGFPTTSRSVFTPETTPQRQEFPTLPPSREVFSTPPESYTSSPQTTTAGSYLPTSKTEVLNRVRGKVHVVCKEEGIEFSATTLFPFTGQIFANERKRAPSCLHNLVNVVTPKVFLPFAECGVKNAGEQNDNRAQYHMQVVVVIQQNDGTSTIQSFMAQCVHQKIHYNKQTLPRRIEEALEELRLVATKLEQKAPLPQVEMKIVVDEHHQLGPEVSEVDIGMPLAVQWKLIPESDAYGFHVKNCVVKDDISGIEHKMIDELGCSTDLSIFAHPHYDTYHDTASSHLWAFKVPDHTRLRIRCDVAICSDIPSSMTNISSCASIPSPPFCPDLITSPTNSILYDAEGAFLKRRRQVGQEETQTVRATLCTGPQCDSQPLGFDKRCFDLHWVAASTGFSFASLIAAIFVHTVVRVKISRQ
ncbi:hypothetical protein Q1695_010032 [Nippostrongylus brasiliensis]|nr:hypothetical protein Q1695_010032 [Nippostrongylus brasiliensis]